MKKWDDHEVHQGIDALEETAFTADDLFDDSLSFHCFSCSRVVVVVVPDSTSGCILRYMGDAGRAVRAAGMVIVYQCARYYCCSEITGSLLLLWCTALDNVEGGRGGGGEAVC